MRYTIRVPTQGTVTTTTVSLEIPPGITVLEIEKSERATFEAQMRGDRIVAITWKKEIKLEKTIG